MCWINLLPGTSAAMLFPNLQGATVHVCGSISAACAGCLKVTYADMWSTWPKTSVCLCFKHPFLTSIQCFFSFYPSSVGQPRSWGTSHHARVFISHSGTSSSVTQLLWDSRSGRINPLCEGTTQTRARALSGHCTRYWPCVRAENTEDSFPPVTFWKLFAPS